MLKILNIVGARPNFMKVAPLMKEYAKYTDQINARLVHTGQHYDDAMSSIFFSQLGMRTPDIGLGVGPGTHAEQTAKILVAFENVLQTEKPDLVVVVGDVNSTMACTIVAAKLLVPVAHVEAGLRSFDRTMPEEVNRLVTDCLADFLFTTSDDASANLAREGVAPEKIFMVGNTMIDTLTALKHLLNPRSVRASLGVGDGQYAYVTLHRPSNVDQRETLSGICRALAAIQERLTLVWPLHPRTKKMLSLFGLDKVLHSLPNVRLIEPIGYLDSISLIADATFVLTDSGGVQEETTALGVPCLTLRQNTERPITITEGSNELVGNKEDVIVERSYALLNGAGKKGRSPKFWDGHAAQRIVTILLEELQ